MTNHPTSDDLFAYRDGELDHERRGLVEAHVLSCTSCAARLEAVSDAEGSLRQMHADPPDAYYEALTDSVMARVAGGSPVAAVRAEKARAVSAGGGTAPADASGAAGAAGAAQSNGAGAEGRSTRAGRRRPFDDVDRGRAPRLPWPAIASAVSAAAAVLVVVVLLFRSQQNPTTAMVEPSKDAATGEDVGTAAPPLASTLDSRSETESDQARGREAGPSAPPAANAPPPIETEVSANLKAGGDEAKIAAKREAESRERSQEIASENANDVVAPSTAMQKASPSEPQRLDMAREKSAVVQRFDASASVGSAGAASGSGSAFGPLLERYGLPPLYDPARVSNEALLRAEPELRYVYQTGGSGPDSARVRLYLAEAARVRAGDSPSAETYDAIVHHYRRAYQLAKDPETARMAKRRLDDFVNRLAPAR